MYINSNLETARRTAIKKGVDSVSVKREMCEKELLILKMRLREAEEELAKEPINDTQPLWLKKPAG